MVHFLYYWLLISDTDVQPSVYLVTSHFQEAIRNKMDWPLDWLRVIIYSAFS